MPQITVTLQYGAMVDLRLVPAKVRKCAHNHSNKHTNTHSYSNKHTPNHSNKHTNTHKHTTSYFKTITIQIDIFIFPVEIFVCYISALKISPV